LVSIEYADQNNLMTVKIPKTTVARLSIYLRALSRLEEEGVETISSISLSDLVGFTAAQIRKDLAYFGQFGVPGRGYFVTSLKDSIIRILGIDSDWSVALVGAGHLGRALMAYKGFKQQHFIITAVFDNDLEKIGKSYRHHDIYSMAELAKTVKANNIKIAIVTVPSEEAQGVVDSLVEAGIKAILSFAPATVTVPPQVKLKRVDLSIELEELSYFLSQKK